MTEEKNKRDKDWNDYLGVYAKIVFQDGFNKDGSEHISIKNGVIEKCTKTHLILLEDSRKHQAINLTRIIRAEW